MFDTFFEHRIIYHNPTSIICLSYLNRFYTPYNAFYNYFNLKYLKKSHSI